MIKSDLKTLQRQFINHLKNSNDNSIINYINFPKEKTVTNLIIYRNNVYGGFEGVLSSIFEVTKKIVGEENFKNLCKEYFANYNSTSGNLDFYGKDFPKIIKEFSKKNKIPYLFDLSKLELSYHLSYFAKDVKKQFPLQKFQQLKEEDFYNVKFKLHPSCKLIKSDFSLFEIWQQNLNNNKIFNEIYQEQSFLLVEKSQNNPTILKLDKKEYLFLLLVKKDFELYKIYEELTKVTKEQFDIGEIFGKFINHQIIINFKI